MTIDRVNTRSAQHAIIGWFIGLAYYNWFAHSPPHLSFWKHVVLVVGGMFGASIVVGASVALAAAALTTVVYKNSQASADFYAWGAFISPVLAFFAAGAVVAWMGA